MTIPLNSIDDNAMNTLLDKSGVLAPYPIDITKLTPVMVFRSEEVTGGANRIPITGYTQLRVKIRIVDLTINAAVISTSSGIYLNYNSNILAWVLPTSYVKTLLKNGHKYSGVLVNATSTKYWEPPENSDPLLNPIIIPEFEATEFVSERCLTTLGYENSGGYFVWKDDNGLYYKAQDNGENGRGTLTKYNGSPL